MSLCSKSPFNPEWINYYLQLNDYLSSFKQSLPLFLEENEKAYILANIQSIQNLIHYQIVEIYADAN